MQQQDKAFLANKEGANTSTQNAIEMVERAMTPQAVGEEKKVTFPSFTPKGAISPGKNPFTPRAKQI